MKKISRRPEVIINNLFQTENLITFLSWINSTQIEKTKNGNLQIILFPSLWRHASDKPHSAIFSQGHSECMYLLSKTITQDLSTGTAAPILLQRSRDSGQDSEPISVMHSLTSSLLLTVWGWNSHREEVHVLWLILVINSFASFNSNAKEDTLWINESWV